VECKHQNASEQPAPIEQEKLRGIKRKRQKPKQLIRKLTILGKDEKREKKKASVQPQTPGKHTSGSEGGAKRSQGIADERPPRMKEAERGTQQR